MPKSVRILFISYDGMTDPLGQSQVLPYLNGLSAAGFNITIISCEKPERFNLVRDVINAIVRENNITWKPIPYNSTPPIISTLKDLRAINRLALQLHREDAFDIVHCRSYIAALIGQKMKRKFGLKMIFDMRGFWADERVDGGLWKLKNPLFSRVYKYFKRKEKEFLASADAVVSLTHAAKTEIERWQLPVVGPITVIPCCVDTHLFDPSKVNRQESKELRDLLRIPQNAAVVGYVGSVGSWYLLTEMLAFFKVYQQERPNAIFLLVTAEPESYISREAEAVGLLPDQLRICKASRKDMPVHISCMNLGLFFIKPAYSKMASSPVKQGEMMSLGLPIICNVGVGDSDRILTKYHSGVLVPEFTDEAYLNAILTFEKTDFNISSIREGAIDYFDLQSGIESYKNIYTHLAHS